MDLSTIFSSVPHSQSTFSPHKVETLPPLGIICSMVYPDADADGLPDGPNMLVIVESQQATGAQLAQLNDLPGVRMIPAHRINDSVDTLTGAQKTRIKDRLLEFDVPLTTIQSFVTVGDIFREVEKHINPNAGGLFKYVLDRASEFE